MAAFLLDRKLSQAQLFGHRWFLNQLLRRFLLFRLGRGSLEVRLGLLQGLHRRRSLARLSPLPFRSHLLRHLRHLSLLLPLILPHYFIQLLLSLLKHRSLRYPLVSTFYV